MRKTFIAWMTLVTAISVSAVAAFYSIVGLTKIFSASAVAVGVMATILEIGKIVTATWLHENWKESPRLLRGYLTSAVVVLMFITSLGIFGFLSDAHSRKSLSLSEDTGQLELIDQQISRERESLTMYQDMLTQLDASINQYFDANLITRGLNQRESQREEREVILSEITTRTNTIDSLQVVRSDIQYEIDSFEAELGPIIYFASLLGNNDTDIAVRIIILLLIFVFDPLAILMLVSANESFKRQTDTNPFLDFEDWTWEWTPESTEDDPVTVVNPNEEVDKKLKKRREMFEQEMMEKRERQQNRKKDT